MKQVWFWRRMETDDLPEGQYLAAPPTRYYPSGYKHKDFDVVYNTVGGLGVYVFATPQYKGWMRRNG